MVNRESFHIKIHDLNDMCRNKGTIVKIKTFEGEEGRITPKGVVITKTGINAITNETYSIPKLCTFKQIFPQIKSIRFYEADKMNQYEVIADRRFPREQLMTFPNGKYQRLPKKEQLHPRSIKPVTQRFDELHRPSGFKKNKKASSQSGEVIISHRDIDDTRKGMTG